MMDASIFYATSEPYYLKEVFHLINDSFTLLRKDKAINKYSRSAIHSKMKELKGEKTNLELEDYLRNDIVNNYINKKKSEYNATKYLEFATGIEETSDNIPVGNLDLKVYLPSSSTIGREPYFVFEFKRVNKKSNSKQYYITGGVNRFKERKYYPEVDSKCAGMIAIMESDVPDNEQSVNDIVNDLNKLLSSKLGSQCIQDLKKLAIKVNNAHFNIYDSVIKRVDQSNLVIYHLFLDYYEIIEE